MTRPIVFQKPPLWGVFLHGWYDPTTSTDVAEWAMAIVIANNNSGASWWNVDPQGRALPGHLHNSTTRKVKCYRAAQLPLLPLRTEVEMVEIRPLTADECRRWWARVTR